MAYNWKTLQTYPTSHLFLHRVSKKVAHYIQHHKFAKF